jgi:Ca2+-binding RTX toxin-like protein
VVTNPTAPPDPRGTRGNDRLVGSAFDNVMDGRRGNDRLIGHDGADTFVFGRQYGRDVLVDFHPEEGDRIDLSGAIGIKGFQDLMKNHVVDIGEHLKIVADDGSVLVVRHFDPAELTKDMFLF